MTQETTILKTDLKNIFDPYIIEHLCRDGYRKTGNKFELSFNGSKGYLSHISVSCEGFQKENNRIFRNELFNKNGSVKKKTFAINVMLKLNIIYVANILYKHLNMNENSKYVFAPLVAFSTLGLILTDGNLKFI